MLPLHPLPLLQVITSAPGHPILQEVLHMMINRARQGFNVSYEHMVHHHTGPGIWTQAVARALGLQSHSARDIARAVWTEPAAYRRAHAMGACVVAASFWGDTVPQNARNLYWSRESIRDELYPSWIKERDKLLRDAGVASETQ